MSEESSVRAEIIDLLKQELEYAKKEKEELKAEKKAVKEDADLRIAQTREDAKKLIAEENERTKKLIAEENERTKKAIAEKKAIKEDADRRIAQTREDAKKLIAEADERTKKAIALADERTKKAIAEKKAIKEDADRRIAQMREDAMKLIADADERTKKAIALGDERLKKAVALGDRRLESFYTFARKTVKDLHHNVSPVLEQAECALKDQKSITYGCRGRILMSDSSIKFDFVEGTEERASIEIAVPTERYVRSREVKIARAVTDYKPAADPTDVITKCIERVQDKWKTQKSSFSNIHAKFTKKSCRFSLVQSSITWSLLIEDKDNEVALPVSLVALNEEFSKVIKDTFDTYQKTETVVDQLCYGLGKVRVEVEKCAPSFDHEYKTMKV